MHQCNRVWHYESVVGTSAKSMQTSHGSSKKQEPVLRLFICISNLKRYLGGECVSVINNGHAIVSIPAVQLHTSAALQQHLVHTNNNYDCRLKSAETMGK